MGDVPDAQADRTRPAGTEQWFRVTLMREVDGSENPIGYTAWVCCEDIGDAGRLVGDRVRANDLDGIFVTGTHVLVPPGEQAGIYYENVARIRPPDPASLAAHPWDVIRG